MYRSALSVNIPNNILLISPISSLRYYILNLLDLENFQKFYPEHRMKHKMKHYNSAHHSKQKIGKMFKNMLKL